MLASASEGHELCCGPWLGDRVFTVAVPQAWNMLPAVSCLVANYTYLLKARLLDWGCSSQWPWC